MTLEPLLKLGLGALDRGDLPGVRACLTGALAAAQATSEDAPARASGEPMTVGEFAAFWKCSAKTVRRMIASGRIPAGAVSGRGRLLRIDVAAAREALAGAPSAPAAPSGVQWIEARARFAEAS